MRKKTRALLERFLQGQATRSRTLDIGCGPRPYRALFPNSVGLDLRGAIDVRGSALALPFRSSSFPTLLATEALEHLPDPLAALEEFHRVLAPGGKLILTTRFVYPFHDPPDYFRFTPLGLRTLAERAGFSAIRIQEELAFSEILHRIQHHSPPARRLLLLKELLILRALDPHLPATGLYLTARKR